jgi:hypothetical protein
MADVLVKPAFQSTQPDDLSQPDAIQPSHFNAARIFSAGSQGQLVQRDTTSTTGASYTSDPTVATVVYPLTTPSAPVNGSFWVEDDGTSVFLRVKRLDGSIVEIEF